MKSPATLIFLSLLCLGTAACSTLGIGGDDDEQEEVAVDGRTAEQLYNDAVAAYEADNYEEAVPLFEKVEQEYPYSKFASKSQLMAAKAAYENDDYLQAIIGFDRFIELHPGSEDVDYAYYLKALAYYEQISDVERDQEITRQALEAFNTLITRFPESQYARDAKLKRDLTLDHLAGKEMEIGRYYLERNQMNAAINRFQTVVRNYQTTTHVAEALHRLVEAYLTLGLRGEAVKVAAVLGHNYPGSKWYQDSYRILDAKSRREMMEDRSILDKTVDTLFTGS
jgi:outer membrane protein assembly factor BamD